MTDEAGLVRTVLDRPHADTPRLVLADWYDEHDEAERAAPVVVQLGAGKL